MPKLSGNEAAVGPFADLVAGFADAVTSNFHQPVSAQPEDQLKTPVGNLLVSVGQMTGLEVNWRTEVHQEDINGRPDIGVIVNGLLTGHVELKRPGAGARAEAFTGRNQEQWQRFQALPNLIYTDGSEWSLYRSGKLAMRARIASDVSAGGSKSIDSTASATYRELLGDFLYWNPVVPGTAEGLAGFLAPMTRVLRDDVQAALARENSQLRRLANEWGGILFPEGDEAQFADAYAQTVTYALLLARFEGAESLRPLVAADTLQREHGLLAEAIQLLEANAVRDELNMSIELLERAIGAVDSAKVGYGGDPWLYFYEQFLGAYDPRLRKDRGVYYTPVEVVRAQVRLAGELLRTRFNKQLMFADDDVVVLDPAVGTGTYPLAVLDHAAETVRDRLGPGAVASKLRSMADRLHAFEVLVGPYSVAHLRLSQRLREAGVTDKTANVYLTDTLESPYRQPDFTASLLQEHLTQERKRALQIKKDTRVFICLGNPPYDRDLRDPNEDNDSRRKGGWVRHGDAGEDAPKPILEDFLAPVREAGDGIHLKPVFNDYVYFWRWALWKVFDSTEEAGIVTFITASSYLRGPGFAGMRRKMREVFDELWILDLEGDNLGARKTENVFAIQIPVAIAIGIRNGPPNPDTPAVVWKTRLTGLGKEKLDTLDSTTSLDDYQWSQCLQGWGDPFQPLGIGNYFDWPAVTDIFPWQHTGAVLYRTWPIGETKTVLAERWRDLLDRNANDRRTAFKETRDRKINSRYRPLMGNQDRKPSIATLEANTPAPPIEPYSFRTFDRQWVIADSRVGDYMRPELWQTQGPQQMYMVGSLVQVLGEGPAVVGCAEIPDQHHFNGRGDRGVIPLWRDVDATQSNVTDGLLDVLGKAHGTAVSAEQLFGYAYGVLAQPTYVERFWDELEQPPPHLPVTKDRDLFERVSSHGARLLHLHTYGARFGGPGSDGTLPQGKARCTKGVSQEQYPASFSYDSERQTLVVGDGEFAPVTPGIWNYSVSGFQIVKSWLDRRKLKRSGRQSSTLDRIRPAQWEFTEELLNLLWLLEATIDLQPEGAALLAEVCASDLFTQDELPTPVDEERRPPQNVAVASEQLGLLDEETN